MGSLLMNQLRINKQDADEFQHLKCEKLNRKNQLILSVYKSN